METSSSRPADPEPAAARTTPARIAAAVLLPPLAIFLAQGVTRDFWIGVALTCLGYIPGVAFALIALLNGRAASPA